VTGATPKVMGSYDELSRVFVSLIGNALKYGHPDRPPIIGVNIDEAEQGWAISISDNGIGLAICRRIIEYHGGHIWLDSIPGQGSKFHLSLPRQPSSNED